jgi:hypothetical protein
MSCFQGFSGVAVGYGALPAISSHHDSSKSPLPSPADDLSDLPLSGILYTVHLKVGLLQGRGCRPIMVSV